MFLTKSSILDVTTKCCSKIHENSNRYWLRGEPLSLGATLGKYQKLTVLDAIKIHFQRLSSLQLISNGLNGVNINLLTDCGFAINSYVAYLVKLYGKLENHYEKLENNENNENHYKNHYIRETQE